MSELPAATDLLPSYDDAADESCDELLPPTIFVLAGQAIYAESTTGAQLYQLNRGVAGLSHATLEVQFERIERSVKTRGDGEPAVKSRPRRIYVLKHLMNVLRPDKAMPSSRPSYYIQAVSSRTLGNVGIRKSRFRSQYKVLPVDVSGKKNEFREPQFLKDAKPLFEIAHKSDRYEWRDGDGNAIAVEDQGEGQHRLLVTASLHRQTLDALAALWACRIWQYSADHHERIHEGMEGVRRKLRLAGQFPG
ncbi:hypothetical protein GQ53DRAFT_835686 [Thozetella sp. PMI_491]|nr:hypothetical protein GQ53DRAFT_835686 [Thozetella sp. PMI_491]